MIGNNDVADARTCEVGETPTAPINECPEIMYGNRSSKNIGLHFVLRSYFSSLLPHPSNRPRSSEYVS
jgi:hypothetical protein